MRGLRQLVRRVGADGRRAARALPGVELLLVSGPPAVARAPARGRPARARRPPARPGVPEAGARARLRQRRGRAPARHAMPRASRGARSSSACRPCRGRTRGCSGRTGSTGRRRSTRWCSRRRPCCGWWRRPGSATRGRGPGATSGARRGRCRSCSTAARRAARPKASWSGSSRCWRLASGGAAAGRARPRRPAGGGRPEAGARRRLTRLTPAAGLSRSAAARPVARSTPCAAIWPEAFTEESASMRHAELATCTCEVRFVAARQR